VRALFEVGDDPPVQLTSILPNTTFASQTVTLTDEVLGSSDASGGLTFKTSHAPVLAGAVLEVFEADGEWVSWIEVADFHGSGSEDRHYVLDHAIGEVLFGDGVHGRIPPRGTGNIRMARYQTGGGEIGNRASNTIVQLKTTVPYIDKVVNLEAAAGGVAAESTAALVARAPRILRHGGRAVALEDFEDLALLASPEVARAKCVPLRRLQDDPLGNLPQAGAVSVVIAPRSTDAKPVPSAELIAQVTDYLSANSTRTASIGVVGPLYVRVDVSVEVALVSLEGASAVEATVREELSRFLHPLTGGRDGTGWDFGRQPHLSDLHAAISDVAGVDHISRLTFVQTEELTGALNTGRFLVYSGEHEITLAFVGAE
jgi:predicted phage baseplate assembly protein